MQLELGDTFLFTLKHPIKVDGKEYSQVWGKTEIEEVAGRLFVKVGGFGNEVFIDPEEIRFTAACQIEPTDETILVRTSEFDDLGTVESEIEPRRKVG